MKRKREKLKMPSENDADEETNIPSLSTPFSKDSKRLKRCSSLTISEMKTSV